MPILVPLPTRNVPASLGFTFCQALVHETGSEHEAARDIQLGGSSDFVYEMLLFSGIIPARENVSAKKHIVLNMNISTKYVKSIIFF